MICDIVIADADVVYVVVDPLLFHCYYSKGVLLFSTFGLLLMLAWIWLLVFSKGDLFVFNL